MELSKSKLVFLSIWTAPLPPPIPPVPLISVVVASNSVASLSNIETWILPRTKMAEKKMAYRKPTTTGVFAQIQDVPLIVIIHICTPFVLLQNLYEIGRATLLLWLSCASSQSETWFRVYRKPTTTGVSAQIQDLPLSVIIDIYTPLISQKKLYEIGRATLLLRLSLWIVPRCCLILKRGLRHRPKATLLRASSQS
jgi:hypothetical protein